MTSTVVDPGGVEWSVRRRWYPWRRALSLRDLWSSASGADEPEPETADEESAALPKNFLVTALLLVVAAIVWVGYGLGKLLFYTAVVALFLIGSVLELLVALVVMPIILLLRVFGRGRWPVEIGRQGKHVLTRHAEDFAAAGDLRDELIADIGRGVLPVVEAASSADSSGPAVGSFED
ncbi:hypothetical protein CIW49_10265 [Mycolicibacterium sp. P1-18]|uniref:hypothetical protein n=1 Tax=Mycolicibacterium sp. P1-18 TaxID=2024615 RepID=UPI0011F10187|nr:hypothetical protein [Mycolicibacterium sp. P1-18]KAA0099920.1 hypothetical protein CIW49_10265 [Mycolicibacterium sp. P1-18]